MHALYVAFKPKLFVPYAFDTQVVWLYCKFQNQFAVNPHDLVEKKNSFPLEAQQSQAEQRSITGNAKIVMLLLFRMLPLAMPAA